DPSDKKEGRSPYQPVLGWFARGHKVDLQPDMPFPAYTRALDQVEGLHALVKKHARAATPGETAATMEFVLEALHQNSLLGKDVLESSNTYSDMMGSMLSNLGPLGSDDDDEESGDDEDDFYRRYR